MLYVEMQCNIGPNKNVDLYIIFKLRCPLEKNISRNDDNAAGRKSKMKKQKVSDIMHAGNDVC